MLLHPLAGMPHTISLTGQRFDSREISSWFLPDEGQCRSRLESPRLHATFLVRGDGEPQRFFGSKTCGPFLLPQKRHRGCTKEACAFRDDYEEFRKLDAEVVGISSDSVE